MKMKNLEKYRTGGTRGKMKLAIPVPRTPNSRAYRYSPNEAAEPRHFLIGNRVAEIEPTEAQLLRMKQPPGTKKTVCPYSGVIDDDDAFIHPEDIKAARATVEHAAVEDVRSAFREMFSDLGRKHKGITFKAGPSRSKPKPRFRRKDLMRELVCDHCGRDYGVYAISLFCPDCGAPNLALHFAREVELVSAQVDLAEALDNELEELAYRLLGNAHEDVLTAFEATLKVAYRHGVSQRHEDTAPVKPVGNDFQNVARGRKRYVFFGFDPFASLSASELKILELNIQKRHVIGHNLGVIDEKFADLAGNAKIGETVALVGEDIRAFAIVAQKVVAVIDEWLVSLMPPPLLASIPEEQAQVQEPSPAADTPMMVGDLGVLPSRVGLWFAKHDPNGLPGSLGDDTAFRAAFSDVPHRDLDDALAKLEADGYVTLYRMLGPELPRINLTSELFAEFDPVALGTDPAMDAVELIHKVLPANQSVSVEELHKETGWGLRRFNPAISYVLGYIGDGHISRGGSFDYPARSFAVTAEERVALRLFQQQVRS
ncbi:hypothetical protein [Phyllobacterium endophyticum]|uniref:Uncharacterized protein n=1 Tax=Phyllobacterium endophyticum TaxID=1149773 RepID=A0A2P7AKG1_9HYPH|nr:hypothetical protein [Phyllobacterium endophyticum]MBB3237053.1 hypothetical protein [Phyllobacterium endophyticum]PSH54699.1 hypothetical protein CU100_26400 [Phyllobacterium endophyticum]TYR40534.1 hypothetical protein FY050_16560 [Phyllobacterium endophyticum]